MKLKEKEMLRLALFALLEHQGEVSERRPSHSLDSSATEPCGLFCQLPLTAETLEKFVRSGSEQQVNVQIEGHAIRIYRGLKYRESDAITLQMNRAVK